MFVCVRDICENVCFGDNCLKININNDDSSPVIIKGYGGVIKNFELCTPIMRSPLDSQDLLLGQDIKDSKFIDKQTAESP